MQQQPDLAPEDILGDFDSLLRQLERPAETVSVESGYVALMARIASPRFRARHEPSGS